MRRSTLRERGGRSPLSPGIRMGPQDGPRTSVAIVSGVGGHAARLMRRSALSPTSGRFVDEPARPLTAGM